MYTGLTKEGEKYLANRVANELPVVFTKVKIGNGHLAGGVNPAESTQLISFKKEIEILEKVQNDNIARLRVLIENSDIESGFFMKELGVYVQDEIGREILYWYVYEDNGQFVYSKDERAIQFDLELLMEVSSNDSTILNWSGEGTWISKKYFDEKVRTFQIANVEEMIKRKNLKVGDIVELLGYYTAGDGAGHKRVIVANPSKPNIKLNNGLYAELLEKIVRPEWVGDTNIYNVIEKHIKPLADNSGYTILLNKGEYTCIGYGFNGTRRMNTLKDLSIIGSGMGEISLPNKEKIIGGTIIHGSVANSADGFKIRDLGIDLGSEWVDKVNHVGWIGDKGDEGLILNEALDRGNLPKLITGCKAENIIVNMYDNVGKYHAFLNEASTGNYVNNVETHGGVHGFVVKCSDITCNNIKVYGGSTNAIIVKNDLRTIKDIRFENVQVYPYKTKGDSNGINIQPNGEWNMLDVSFKNVFIHECSQGFLGNKADGIIANISMDNVVISNCVNPTDLSNLNAGLTWYITNVRVVNSGHFYLPKTGTKVVKNLTFEQHNDLETQRGDSFFTIYNRTYIDGLYIDGKIGYNYGAKIDSDAVYFSAKGFGADASLDANFNKYFIEDDDQLYTVENRFHNYLLSPDFTTNNENTYLYQTYGNRVVRLSFCLYRSADTTGSVLFTKNPNSAIGFNHNQRFACGRFSDTMAVPVVAGVDGRIITERIENIKVGDYIYGQIEINTRDSQIDYSDYLNGYISENENLILSSMNLEEEKNKMYKLLLQNNPELTYKEFEAQYSPIMSLEEKLKEPVIPQTVQDFMKKYL